MKASFTRRVLLVALLAISGCGQKESREAREGLAEEQLPFYADTLLPPVGVESDFQPVVETRIIRPAGAGEYLGQTAADYAAYRFVGMAVSRYLVHDVSISVEVTQFTSVEDAYGFYARLRPFDAQLGMVGTESFLVGNSLYFTAGLYSVTMSVEEMNPASNQALSLLAGEIVKRIGPSQAPMLFVMFPWKGKINASNQYFSSDFLGRDALDEVYTTAYALESDTATFFLAVDQSGEKFLALRELAHSSGEVVPVPPGFEFPGYSVAFNHPERGMIVAGLVKHKMVGVVNYKADTYEELATGWVKGLQ